MRPTVHYLNFHKNSFNLIKKSTDTSAGYDVIRTTTCTIEPKPAHLVSTDIIIELPPRIYIQIMPRSGLATKGITCHPGVIDPDY
jgi:dUTPase